MTILELMEQVRAEFPTDWTHEDRGAYLNKVAWLITLSGVAKMGLLSKPAGNNCPTPAGPLCSCDYLVDKATMNGYDVLVDESKPTWPGFDHPSDNFSLTPERWVAPVQPGEIPPDPPEPPDLVARVAELEQSMNDVVNLLEAFNNELGNLYQWLNSLEAVGQTGRVGWHSHPVTLTVRRKS